MLKALTWLAILLALNFLSALNYIEFFVLHPFSNGLMSPDFRFFGYSYDAFTQWRTALGDEGAAAYIKWFPNGFDRYFPAIMGITIALVLHQVLNRFPRYNNRSALLKVLVPLMFSLPYVFFDYFENLVVLDALSGTGNAGAAAVQFASSLTVLKASFMTISLVVMMAFFLASLKIKDEKA